MGSNPDREPPESKQDDMYVTDEDEQSTMAGRFGGPDSGDQRGGSDGLRSRGLIHPIVYLPVLGVGAVLFFIPEPITTTVGVGLLLVGAFLAAVDVLSSS